MQSQVKKGKIHILMCVCLQLRKINLPTSCETVKKEIQKFLPNRGGYLGTVVPIITKHYSV